MKNITTFSLLIINALSCGNIFAIPFPLKPYEKWWSNHLRSSEDIVKCSDWWGNEDAISRAVARIHIKGKGYKSILDIPCGLCADYLGFKKAGIDIEYLGIDITEQLVTRAIGQGIPAKQGSIEKIPCKDSAVDICYVRHILEHLPSYEDALRELIRVAKKEVLIVFFVPPHDGETAINSRIVDGDVIYYNWYNKAGLEKFIKRNPKVHDIEWGEVTKEECILHIYLDEEWQSQSATIVKIDTAPIASPDGWDANELKKIFNFNK